MSFHMVIVLVTQKLITLVLVEKFIYKRKNVYYSDILPSTTVLKHIQNLQKKCVKVRFFDFDARKKSVRSEMLQID